MSICDSVFIKTKYGIRETKESFPDIKLIFLLVLVFWTELSAKPTPAPWTFSSQTFLSQRPPVVLYRTQGQFKELKGEKSEVKVLL
jgi:hypothetical protein